MSVKYLEALLLTCSTQPRPVQSLPISTHLFQCNTPHIATSSLHSVHPPSPHSSSSVGVLRFATSLLELGHFELQRPVRRTMPRSSINTFVNGSAHADTISVLAFLLNAAVDGPLAHAQLTPHTSPFVLSLTSCRAALALPV